MHSFSPKTLRTINARIGAISCLLGASLGLACGAETDDGSLYTTGSETTNPTGETTGTNASDSSGADSSTSDDAESSTSAESASTSDEGDSTDTDASDSGPLLDVAADTTASGEGGDGGCAKVDFLFVVDNSGSMSEEQANLATSFPGFIDAIQGTLMAQDYHIMVTDTDSVSAGASSVSIGGGTVTCETHPNCCIGVCNGLGGTVILPPPTTCNGEPCTNFPIPEGCEATLGAGRDYDQNGDSCNIANGASYMLETQPDLLDTFSCAALVGPNGDGLELPMEAMMQAIGSESDAGGCNEGFLRDDAILVVTFITDEDDDGQSMGDPTSWKNYLVDAKGGNEDAVVVLGIIADEGFPGGTCTDNGDAPVLRSFAESFNYGTWASVCEPDYTQFFVDAVSVIDTACDGFIPPD